MNIVVREEQDNDIQSIYAVTRSAFLEVAHSSHTEHFIVDALRDSSALYISLVAELDGQIIGHVAISPVSVSDSSLEWYGLGPISVLPEYQKQGIGSLLVQRVLDLLRQRAAVGCVLLGNPGFYERFGFTVMNDLVLPDVPPEYFQALSFGGFYAQGTVEYHKAFSAIA